MSLRVKKRRAIQKSPLLKQARFDGATCSDVSRNNADSLFWYSDDEVPDRLQFGNRYGTVFCGKPECARGSAVEIQRSLDLEVGLENGRRHDVRQLG